MKQCKRCGCVKPLTEFYITTRGNHDGTCKACRIEAVRRNQAKKGLGAGRTIKRGEHWYITQRGKNKLRWSGDMLSVVKKYYSTTPNQELMEMLGVNYRQLRGKAKELGLEKSREYLSRIGQENGRVGYIIRRKRQHEGN